MKIKNAEEVRMVTAVIGAVLFVAGLGSMFILMPVAVIVALVCVVPVLVCVGLYNLLRLKENIGLRAPIRVLIVDDDIDSALVTARAFTTAGWHTDIATTPAMALDYLSYSSPSLVVLDWVLTPVLNGGDLLENASITLSERERHNVVSPVPVVSLSSTPSYDISYSDSEYFKPLEYWQKPFGLSEMVTAANRIARAVAV
jgi:CheY-like chemotaxis protein